MAREVETPINSLDYSNGSTTPPSDDLRIALQQQNINQRRWLFWTCLVFCTALYFLFFWYILHPDGLSCQLTKTPFSILIATLAGAIPTVILATLISATYKHSKPEKDDGDDIIRQIDLLSKLSTISRGLKTLIP